jgi:hypothetical protein
VVVSDPEGEHARIYRAMAARIWEKLGGTTRRAAPRILAQ